MFGTFEYETWFSKCGSPFVRVKTATFVVTEQNPKKLIANWNRLGAFKNLFGIVWRYTLIE